MGGHHSSHDRFYEKDGEGGSGFSTPRAGSRRGTTPRGSAGDIEKPEKAQPTSMVPIEKLGKVGTLERTVGMGSVNERTRSVDKATDVIKTNMRPNNAISCCRVFILALRGANVV